jgi:hypothetical protein
VRDDDTAGDEIYLLSKILSITEDELTLDLLDVRTISVPLGWYPRLLHGSPTERVGA